MGQAERKLAEQAEASNKRTVSDWQAAAALAAGQARALDDPLGPGPSCAAAAPVTLLGRAGVAHDVLDQRLDTCGGVREQVP